MNSVERTALLFHRDTIVQNVDLAYIKEKLLAYGILNHEELEEIDYEKTRSAKIRKVWNFSASSLTLYLNINTDIHLASGLASKKRTASIQQIC